MSIPRFMFYGSTAIRDEPELPDYKSESDLNNIDENEMIKKTGDDSSDFSDNNSICDDDNISESDHVKSRTILGKDKCTSWNSEPPRRNKISFTKRKAFMLVYLLILLPLHLILF